MRYGVIGTAGTATQQVELAQRAEAAGWDGYFTWDGISIGSRDTFDPWVLLGGVATATTRITLGAMIFALPRRKPWKVLREALTIDHLSGGRFVMPVALGAVDDRGFSGVRPTEPIDVRTRAQRLDEILEVLDRGMKGRPFSFEGSHFAISDMVFQPTPVNGTIPIWVVAVWPSNRSMRRTVPREGVIPQPRDGQVTAEMIVDIRRWLSEAGAATSELVVEGISIPGEHERVRALDEAGATWWIESDWSDEATFERLVDRVEAGPPSD